MTKINLLRKSAGFLILLFVCSIVLMGPVAMEAPETANVFEVWVLSLILLGKLSIILFIMLLIGVFLYGLVRLTGLGFDLLIESSPQRGIDEKD